MLAVVVLKNVSCFKISYTLKYVNLKLIKSVREVRKKLNSTYSIKAAV